MTVPVKPTGWTTGPFTLRGIEMPSMPGLTSAGQTDQAGATYSSGVTTITGKNITSTITVSGTAVVTITDCVFDFDAYYQIRATGGSLTIRNCYFTALSQGENTNMLCIDCTGGTQLIELCEFESCENSVRGPWDGEFRYNYIHGPMNIGAVPHVDGIEMYGCADDSVEIHHNVIDIRDSTGQTGCVNGVPFGSASAIGVKVYNNSFTGGSYALYINDVQTSGEVSGWEVYDNQWITSWDGDAASYTAESYAYGSVFGPASVPDGAAAVDVWTGNVLLIDPPNPSATYTITAYGSVPGYTP